MESTILDVDTDNDFTLDTIAINETHQTLTQEFHAESSLLISAEALSALSVLFDSDFKSISIESLTFGLEADESTLTKIWNGIKAFFYRIGQAIKNFFLALFDSVRRLITRLQHQEQQLDNYFDNKWVDIHSSLLKNLFYIKDSRAPDKTIVDLGASVIGLTDFKWQLDGIYRTHDIIVEGIASIRSEKEYDISERVRPQIEHQLKGKAKAYIIGGYVLEPNDRQGHSHKGTYPILSRLVFPFVGEYEAQANVAVMKRLVAEAIGVCKLLLQKKDAYANASLKVKQCIEHADREMQANNEKELGKIEKFKTWIHARTLYGKTNKNFVDMNRIGFHAARAVSSVCNSYFKAAKAHVELPDEPNANIHRKQSQLLLTN